MSYMNSETPRTDGWVHAHQVRLADGEFYVTSDFGRQLERELIAAGKTVEELKMKLSLLERLQFVCDMKYFEQLKREHLRCPPS